MDSERWRKIEQVYHLALEQGPALQDRFLADACQGDTELRGEVESLLAQSGCTDLLVDQTAWAEANDLAATGTVLATGAKLARVTDFAPGSRAPWRRATCWRKL